MTKINPDLTLAVCVHAPTGTVPGPQHGKTRHVAVHHREREFCVCVSVCLGLSVCFVVDVCVSVCLLSHLGNFYM